MTRSSESRAQRASRRGTANNAASGSSKSDNDNNEDERDQAARQERTRHRRRSSTSRNEAEAPADREAQEREERQEQKLTQFIQILNQGAPPPHAVRGYAKFGGPKIDRQKALNILEATAGNMALAANLYWEDYFAADQLEVMGELNNRGPVLNPDGDDGDLDQKKPAAEAAARGGDRDQFNDPRRGIDLENFGKPKRRLRRSLDSDFQAADDDDETKRKKRAKKRARKSTSSMESNGEDSNDGADDDEQKMPAFRRRNRNQEDVDNEREAQPQPIQRSNRRQVGGDDTSDDDNVISVSDDEFGKVGYYKDSKAAKPAARRRDRDPARKIKEDDVSRSAVMKAARDINLKIDPDKTHLSKPSTWFLSPEQGKRRERDHDDDSVDSNSENYIGDDDWLGDETYSPSIPMEYVWGAAHDYYTIDPYDEEDTKKTDDSSANVVADDEAMDVSGEQEDANENNKESFKSVPLLVEGRENRGIPHTWLNAAFQMSECGSGLVIKSPTVEEVEFFAWRQTQVNDKRNAVPPPQHCKSLTAIISIVTGLLYTGASIQGSEVNFTSAKAPWSSLTVEQRKREFESRLSDALSSLIFVAAQASLKRKKKAYRKAIRTGEVVHVEDSWSQLFREAVRKREEAILDIVDDNKSDNEEIVKKEPAAPLDWSWKEKSRTFTKETLSVSQEMKELMRRRLELIPTCVWAEKKDVVKPRPGDAGCFFNTDARVKTSWTNIQDIKLYVESNLRAFTDKGGIALFLETLLRIHGDNYIGRQLMRCAEVTSSISVTGKRGGEIPEKGSRGEFICKGGKTSVPLPSVYAAGYPSLIRCTCEDRQKKIHEKDPLPLNVRVDPTKLLDTTPPGTECVSIELLTLILTGHVSSDWKDCSSEKLGIGLLTENVGEVSQGLARPKQPVWMLKGETCYTMLAIDGSWTAAGSRDDKESRFGSAMGSSNGADLKTISRVDKPNMALNLCHWNGWYGQRSKTGMRLVPPSQRKEVPSKKLLAQFSKAPGVTDTRSSIMRRRRYEHVINAISAEQHESNEAKEKEVPIRPIELKRITINAEDQKLYPNNHKMWRFDLGEDNDDMDKKPSAQSWIPYFKLTSRQKRLVETKLGPKINSIIWTRWPGAVIDNFTASEEGFPVV